MDQRIPKHPNWSARVAVVFTAFAIALAVLAFFGIGTEDAFSTQTPRITTAILAIWSLLAAALCFLVGVWLTRIHFVAKVGVTFGLLAASAYLGFIAFFLMMFVG